MCYRKSKKKSPNRNRNYYKKNIQLFNLFVDQCIKPSWKKEKKGVNILIEPYRASSLSKLTWEINFISKVMHCRLNQTSFIYMNDACVKMLCNIVLSHNSVCNIISVSSFILFRIQMTKCSICYSWHVNMLIPSCIFITYFSFHYSYFSHLNLYEAY